MHCCWNGMVALNAAPFKKGLRFRAALDGHECRGSECSILCNDLHLMGHRWAARALGGWHGSGGLAPHLPRAP